jgi:hypothetical protein
MAFPQVAPNAWWSIPGGSSQTLNVEPNGSSSAWSAVFLADRHIIPSGAAEDNFQQESPLGRTRKQAYGKVYSVIEVYVRRRGIKERTRPAP